MTGVRFDFQPAAVPLRERINDRNAETGAGFAFRCEERLENSALDLRRNSRTIILDFDPCAVIRCAGAHGDTALSLKSVHGIQ